MLSILIPVYQRSVIKLVDELKLQCEQAGIIYQIIVFDDKSKSSYRKKNRPLRHYFNVNYVELSENLGRARIRNWLAKAAQYPYLLYLDCDSKIKYKTFIKKYIEHKDDAEVVNGGRVYTSQEPKWSGGKRLHWIYGTQRESKPAEKRNQRAVAFFHSNNFLVHARVMKHLPFDESIDGYGYEDIVLANQIKKHGYRITHIDNPVVHMGLEKTNVFLEKQLKAAENLAILYAKNGSMGTKLEQVYENLKRAGLVSVVAHLIDRGQDYFEKQLRSENPRLRWLDFIKLGAFIQGIKKVHTQK